MEKNSVHFLFFFFFFHFPPYLTSCLVTHKVALNILIRTVFVHITAMFLNFSNGMWPLVPVSSVTKSCLYTEKNAAGSFFDTVVHCVALL